MKGAFRKACVLAAVLSTVAPPTRTIADNEKAPTMLAAFAAEVSSDKNDAISLRGMYDALRVLEGGAVVQTQAEIERTLKRSGAVFPDTGSTSRVRIWYRTWIHVRPTFLQECASIVSCDAAPIGDEPLRAQLNRWAVEADVRPSIPSGAIRASADLYITGTDSLQALWREPFPTSGTTRADFHSAFGIVSVPMMEHVVYADKATLAHSTAVRLDTATGDVVTLFLPKVGRRMKAAASDALEMRDSDFRRQGMVLEVPRFSISSWRDEAPLLRATGIKHVFMGSPFPRIASEPLSVVQFLHGASITVNEAGIRTDSETVIPMEKVMIVKAETLRFDRPFFVLVRHEGRDVFAAAVSSP